MARGFETVSAAGNFFAFQEFWIVSMFGPGNFSRRPSFALSGELLPELPSEIPSGFREFIYEPSVEQQVVGLFFRILPELDLPICIEEVRGKFPDCLAWRETEDGYEEYRIEFEYFSSGAREHENLAGECVLVVCWEDDWPDSPVEVMELEKELEDLPEEFILIHRSKHPKMGWSEEDFFDFVRKENPEIFDAQKKIYNALKDSEKVNIIPGRGRKFPYRFYIPSTDNKAMMGIDGSGSAYIAFKDMPLQERKRLSAGFLYKLGIELDYEKEWTGSRLKVDLWKEDVDDFLEIILGN